MGEIAAIFSLAKRRTNKVETSHLGDSSGQMSNHSHSGWMTVETFKHYRTKLREVDIMRLLFFVSDVIPAIRTAEVSVLPHR